MLCCYVVLLCCCHKVKLEDLGREGAVVAHFVAHAGPDVHIAGLAFNPR